MINIKEAIIVEGKYDKMRLESICSSPIFTTEGFRVFNDREKREFLKRLAKERGILILTDSDRAGFMIRNRIKSFIDEGEIKQAYIPEVFGKEKRKTVPSKEGKLGVEGISEEVLSEILSKYASSEIPTDKITKTDLYDAGLYGGAQCAAARTSLCRDLGIPTGISTNALVDALNALITKEEFLCMTTLPQSFIKSTATE